MNYFLKNQCKRIHSCYIESVAIKQPRTASNLSKPIGQSSIII